MPSGRATCSLVEEWAARMCGWCSRECIREGLEGRGPCRSIAWDAFLLVLASRSWLPPPGLGDDPARVLEWASRSLYYASVAPLLASRRYSPLIGSRGLWSRRVVERLLLDYWLVSGYRIVATDSRLPGGWVTHPTLASCPGGAAETRVEPLGGLGLRLEHRCGGEVVAVVELRPPEPPPCKG